MLTWLIASLAYAITISIAVNYLNEIAKKSAQPQI
jgi:hypothetical protein